MSIANKDVKLLLKVTVNKQKRKVLFAEVDGSFADVLFSFLTLPLAAIVRILKKHYGDEATPAFGKLEYSSDAECKRLKLEISDSPPSEEFVCPNNNCSSRRRRRRFEGMYGYGIHDSDTCIPCTQNRTKRLIEKRLAERLSSEPYTQTVARDGVFTISTAASFLITDDLQIVSNTGLLQIVPVLGNTDMDKAETMNITFGKAEVMDLLKASLISSTPLSDIILNKTGEVMNTRKRKCESQRIMSLSDDNPNNSKKMKLKVMVQKSTNKLLYAEAEEDLVEFLFSLLAIPLGRNADAKNKLINPKIPRGYISEHHILPFTAEECLPSWHQSVEYPREQGNYLTGLRTYQVTDDLTVAPFSIVSILSRLNQLKVPTSDVKEVQLQIGLNEGLRILKASLTSTSALTDALLINQNCYKQPKQEINLSR
ncbi:hypothetical protein C2S52_011734 [Perilla frutescens var. hirtella]|nr:hypothetical protein C2S52_011734 [Perilla frutescens var. hirtella]